MDIHRIFEIIGYLALIDVNRNMMFGFLVMRLSPGFT
jgi:hypothetical protein